MGGIMGRERIPAPEPGLYAGVPEDEYHAWDAVSNSSLTPMLQSPAHYLYQLENPEEPTESMRLGTALHRLVLEPERFEEHYHVFEKLNWTTKEGRAQKEQLLSVWKEDQLLTTKQAEKVFGMRDAIMGNPEAKRWLDKATHRELSGVWVDRVTGLLCKMRIDAIIDGVMAIDLKTTDVATYPAFQKKIYDYGYHRQGAMYIDGVKQLGVKVNHFGFIPVEKEPYHGVGTFRLDDASIGAGKAQLEDLMAKVAACRKTGLFPGYPVEIRDIGIPEWAMKQIEKGF